MAGTTSMSWRAGLVVTGAVLLHLSLGSVNSFGNMSVYVTSYLRHSGLYPGLTYGHSVWIQALTSAGHGASVYLGGQLQRRFGPRVAVGIGCGVMSVGVLLTHVTIQLSLSATVVTYGLMVGVGMGLAYAAPLTVAMKWAGQRKTCVAGVVLAGFGCGTPVFVLLQTAFINPDNRPPDLAVGQERYFRQDDVVGRVPGIFLVQGASTLALQTLGLLLLRNPPDAEDAESMDHTKAETRTVPTEDSVLDPNLNHATSRDQPAENGSQTEMSLKITGESDPKDLSPRELLKERSFYTLWVIFLLNDLGAIFILSLYKAYGETFIDDDRFLALVGTAVGLSDAVGSAFWGFLGDIFSYKTTMSVVSCVFSGLMLTLSATPVLGGWTFLLWVSLLTVAWSGTFVLLPPAVVRSFGPRHAASNLGLLYSAVTVGAVLNATLTSALLETIGWQGMFFTVAACAFIGFLFTTSFNRKMPDGSDV